MGVVQRLTRYALSATQPSSRWMTRGPRSSRVMALTFDDGPHPEHTPRLLDLLAELDVRATFFVIGDQARAYPEIVRRIACEGHLVANHSWFHHEPARQSARELEAEVLETRALISDLTGHTVNLFRPPKGQLTWAKIGMLWNHQQTIALWNVDPKDFAMPDLAAATQWEARYSPRPGDIVLFHDNHPWSAGILPQLVAKARYSRLGFVTLDELVRGGNVVGSTGNDRLAERTSSNPVQASTPSLESAVTP